MKVFATLQRLLLVSALFIMANLGFAQSNQWTWMKGSNSNPETASYGTQGVESASNTPGGRAGCVSSKDGFGNVWVYGGIGITNVNGSTYIGFTLSDLWKYNNSTNRWTWIKGSSGVDETAVYGTQGTPSNSNTPGIRADGCSWTDASGNFWLFGGAYSASYSDLWKYNITTNQWTWVKGSNSANAQGVYGTQGTAANGNLPGARKNALTWVDNSGNFWMFGGYGYAETGSGYLNDLWRYNISTNQWTWVSGDKTPGATGIYGTKGVAAQTNKPGSRNNAMGWTDGTTLWLFGGTLNGANGVTSSNELSKYSISSNSWSWMGGDNTANWNGFYGSVRVASTANVVPGRESGVTAVDSLGNLLLFGGYNVNAPGFYNDLWRYNPSTNLWTFLRGYAGPSNSTFLTSYGTQGVSAASNQSGIRTKGVSWADAGGNFWTFGGRWDQSIQIADEINEVWRYVPPYPPVMSGFTPTSTAQGTTVTITGMNLDLVTSVTFGGTAAASFTIVDSRTITAVVGAGASGSVTVTSLEGTASLPGFTFCFVPAITSATAEGVGTTTITANGVSGSNAVLNWWTGPGGTGTNLGTSTSIVQGPGTYYARVTGTCGAPAEASVTVIATNQWTWMGGNDSLPQYANYGTIGVSSPTNTPGARQDAVTWTDASGDFWLFGGYGNTETTVNSYLNDLWKYNRTTNQWTWMKGDKTSGTGVYGTLGVPADANKPGTRQNAVGWADASVNLWLFGGYNAGFYLNDLWKYNIATNQWTWVKGSSSANQKGAYGILGTSATANAPGARNLSTGWKDAGGNFWLFGGIGYGNSVFGNYLNDLWKYNPVANEWTWVSGDSAINQRGVYGTLATAAPTNKPGGRNNSTGWADGSGNLWLFGGGGIVTSTTGTLNDLWKYNIATNAWTWMKGDSVTNRLGIYGTQGTSAASNKPGSRSIAISWSDASGNAWVFGGNGYSAASLGYLSDLWKYNPAINEWTWANGSNAPNQNSTYGTAGTASAFTKPGGRYSSAGWIDGSANLWLFGGFGYSANTNVASNLNDLFKYTPSSGVWTWLRGDTVSYPVAVYGTQGVAASTNKPGGRQDAVRWTDASGNLWMFGGTGYTETASGGLNDLWKYNRATKQWTWMKGDKTVNAANVYGTQGVSAATNKPGYRSNAVGWSDASGNLWLYGGQGTSLYLNDLWRYNIATNEWTWMKGSSTGNQPGVYGTQGTAASANVPGGRLYATAWTDAAGNLWMHGGSGYASVASSGFLSDLWKYNTTTNLWTWMKGDNTINQDGVYGTLGTSAGANQPGSRYAAVGWSDASNNLWLFGGFGNVTTTSGYLNDLWKYNTSSNEWTWVKGDSAAGRSGVYGTMGTSAAANKPSARYTSTGWSDATGNLWLMGGNGTNGTYLNDVWRYNPLLNEWTWVNGSNSGSQLSVYGTKEIAGAANHPGGRYSPVSWADGAGNAWLFGGYGYPAYNTTTNLNDLWKYVLPNPPTLTSFTPTTAMTGMTVTLTGTYFLGTTSVTFGGVAATSFTVVNSTTITAVVAAGATGSVSVQTPEGSVSLAGFTYYAPPVVTPSVGNTLYTEGTPVATDAGITVTDQDNTTLASATVSITTGFLSTQDVLQFTDQNGITGSYNAATGVLSLTGTATVAQYQLALRSILYNNTSQNPNTTNRIISYVANDGTYNSNAVTKTITITAVNTAPVVTCSGGNTAYTEGSPVAVDAGLTTTDGDNTNLASASVSIATGFISSEDVLQFTNQNGITGNYSAATGILTLTGSATLANYQAALRSVLYNNTSQNPNTANRTISFVVNDGALSSSATTKVITITAVNNAPVITASGGSTSYTEGTPVIVDGAVIASDPDNATLASATVSITTGFQTSQDVLQFTNQNGITGSYNAATGVLSLTGLSTVANYQTALRSVKYSNTSLNPNTTTRIISFVVNDGALNSNTVTKTVTITAINNAPVVTTSGGNTSYFEGTNIAVDAALTAIDPDNTNLTSATVTIAAGLQSSEDALVFSNQNGITGIYTAATGVLSLTGSATVANYQTALRSVMYSNSSATPNTANRTITFVTSDGALSSNSASKVVTVTAVNNIPVVTASGGSTSYIEGSQVIIDAAIGVADADNTILSSAMATITTGFQQGQDALLFTAQNGIAGSYNGVTGVLTLTGTASVTNYQAALRSVYYSNSSTAPNTANRVVSFVVNDGEANSVASNKIITVTSINNAPGFNVIADFYVNQNAPAQTINITGINDGGDGGQMLTLTAASSNTGVIPNPVVNYSSPNITGSLSFTPVANTLGTSTITVALTDNGGVANGGVNTFSRTFTVTVAAAPIITSFTPAIASAGTSVTITGTSFNGTTAVSFGGMPAASYTVINSTTIIAVVGGGATGSVNVTTPVGTATTAGFTFCIVPSITTQPAASQIICQNTTPANLSVSATGSVLTYQWYSNTSNSNNRGRMISGATSATYTPPTTVAGTMYYYVVVGGTCGTKTSNTSAVVVNAVSTLPTAFDFEGAFPPAGVSIVNGDSSYTWQQTAVTGSNGAPTQSAYVNTFAYDATGQPDDIVLKPYAIVNDMYKLAFDRASARYPGMSDRLLVLVSTNCGATFTDTLFDKQGDDLATATASASSFAPASAGDWKRDTLNLDAYSGQTIIVKFRVINGYSNNVYVDNISLHLPCLIPTITGQPQAAQSVCQNSVAATVSVTASNTTAYQWYSNVANANSGGTLISGATSAFYAPVTTAAGTMYFYAVATGTCGNTAASAVSKVTVSPVITLTTSSIVVCNNSQADLNNGLLSSTAGLTIGFYSDAALTAPISSTVTSAGTYYVKASTNECMASAAIPVTFSTSPSFTTQPILTNCDATNTDLNNGLSSVTTGLNMQFYSDNVYSAAISNIVNSIGTYYVKVSNAAGCLSFGSIDVLGDITAPTITCPNSVTASFSTAGANTGCSRTVTLDAPTGISDNCTPTPILTWEFDGATPGSGTGTVPASQLYNVGRTKIKYTVTDAAGNSTTCNTTIVTIVDDIIPSINNAPSNMSMSTDAGSCAKTLSFPTIDATDNCQLKTVSWLIGGATVVSGNWQPGDHLVPTALNPGVNRLKYTIRDGAGNTVYYSYELTVIDNTPPVVAVPSAISENLSTGCSATIMVPNPTIDVDCSGIASVTWKMTGATSGASKATGVNYIGTQTFNGGVTTITYTVKDGLGNAATQSFTVTVIDAIAPTVTCPSNISDAAAATSCSKKVAVPNAIISDNCRVVLLTWVMTGATSLSSPTTGINQILAPGCSIRV